MAIIHSLIPLFDHLSIDLSVYATFVEYPLTSRHSQALKLTKLNETQPVGVSFIEETWG